MRLTTTKGNTQAQRFFGYVLVLFLGMLGVHCANRMMPPGGPVDRTPPSIIETDPPNGSTSVRRNVIRLRFNQYVDERSVEESIFISPYVGQLEFEWSGKEVEIRFSQPLQPSTTYVVNVGTDVIGYYTKTRMAQAFTLAFSTDSIINRGALSGKILPRRENDAQSGVMIFAYRLDGVRPDTLTPLLHSPHFITQTGSRGDFSLVHIPWGTYRLYAIRDEFRNLLYDPESDDIGICSKDYSLTENDSLATDIVIQLTREDTTAPRLLTVAPTHHQQIEATFSEALLPSSLQKESFSIIDTTTSQPLEVLNVFPKPSRPSVIVITTAPHDSLSIYRLTVKRVCDSSGNIITPFACSSTFNGLAVPDTLPFKLMTVSVSDSTRNVSLSPRMVFQFSDAVDTSLSTAWIEMVSDTFTPVPLTVTWQTLTTVFIQPMESLESLRWYTLRAHLRNIHSWNGKVLVDSIKEWHFQTLDAYELGSLRGEITTASGEISQCRLYVLALSTEKSGERYVAPVAQTGTFVFPFVVGGRYTLRVFEDWNGNGTYDGGKPFPFVPSEPLVVFRDTLRVRPRWPLEGVKLTVPFGCYRNK